MSPMSSPGRGEYNLYLIVSQPRGCRGKGLECLSPHTRLRAEFTFGWRTVAVKVCGSLEVLSGHMELTVYLGEERWDRHQDQRLSSSAPLSTIVYGCVQSAESYPASLSDQTSRLQSASILKANIFSIKTFMATL